MSSQQATPIMDNHKNRNEDNLSMKLTEVKDQANTVIESKTSEKNIFDGKLEPNHGPTEEMQSSNRDASPANAPKNRRYTVLSEKEKIFTISIFATMNVLIFFSSTMYLPALESMGKTLKVSTSKMYLTITAYMVTQGIAPLFTGYLSDIKGRRPILFVCFSISLACNIGLARQTSFAALISLRCIQSVGTTGASVITIAAIIDIVARSERGKYMAYSTMGSTIGTSVGPVVGGVLTQYLGWRSVFWFLAVFSGIAILLLVIFLQETCRAVVGNGSIPPQPWNKTLIRRRKSITPNYETQTEFRKPPRIVDSIKLLGDKQIGILILFWCLVNWGQAAVQISIPILMTKNYGFNSLQVGLCFIPMAVGGIAARWSVGTFADWNFRRLARQVGVDVQRNQQTKEDLEKMPLEKVRLQIAFPAFYLCCIFLIGYSWTLAYNLHIAAPLIFLFFLGNAGVGATNVLAALIMDMQAYQPGMTRASMNMGRCLPIAGVAAGINPAIQVIGLGWLGTLFAGCWLVFSPALWVVYFHGEVWRKGRKSNT